MSGPSDNPDPPAWPRPVLAALDRVIRTGGVAMLVGAGDTGKSTLACELVNRGLASGRLVAVVDADVGQTDIGPPTCIGMGIARAPIASLGDIAAAALHFVGSTSPFRHLLPAVVGTSLLVRAGRAQGADLVVVDTTGLVRGPAAEALKFHKIQAVRPRSILALQAGTELEPVLAPFAGPGGPRIMRLAVAPGVRAKPPDLRRQRRERAFAAYLAGARPAVLDRSTAALWPDPGPARLRGLRGAVCGLLDGRGATLALGIIQAADPYSVTVLTPLEDATGISAVVPGEVRVGPDGREL